jgi:transcriptional regulator with XRE-family HTH domain
LFLQRLKSARLDVGITQTEAAARLGRPQSFVSKCESGERRVDFVEVEIFAAMYRKGIEFFITGEDAAIFKPRRISRNAKP